MAASRRKAHIRLLATTPAILVAVLAPFDAGARPRPPACTEGRFLVREGGPLIAGAALEAVAIDPARTLTVTSGCPAVPVKLTARRRGTRVVATWPAGACSGLRGRARLTALVDPGCRTLRGRLQGKKFRKGFLARRSECSDGVRDGNEICDRLEGPPEAPARDATVDLDPQGAAEEDVVGGVILTRLDVYPEPSATTAQVNAALTPIGGRIASMVAGHLPLTVTVPRQPDLEALAALADTVSAAAGILVAVPARESQLDALPPGNAGANPDEFAYLHPSRFPAAWNARRLATAGCAGRRVPVVIGDAFLNPSSAGPGYARFSRDIPNFRGPTGDFRKAASTHGLDVTLVLAAAFDDRNPTGANPFSECLDVHAVQLSGISELEVPRRMATKILGLPPGSPFVVNTSFGFFEPHCPPAPCIETDFRAPGTTPPVVRAMATADWAARTHSRWSDFVLTSAAGNSLGELPALIFPGLGRSELSSVFNMAKLLDPLTDQGLSDAIGNPVFWNPTVVTDALGVPFPSLVASSTDRGAVGIAELGLPHPLNVIVAGCSTLDGSPESTFSERPNDVIAVGEGIVQADGSVGKGTSYSAPQVAGLISYLWLLSPELRSRPVTDTGALIRATARLVGDALHLDAYAAILALDGAAPPTAASAPVRKAILDIDDDGDFDQGDLVDFVGKLIDPNTDQLREPSFPDFSRADLNGDGFTGLPIPDVLTGKTPISAFDLDPVGSTRFGARSLGHVEQQIEHVPVPFNEENVTDLEVLCFNAYSGLYADGEEAQRQRRVELKPEKRCMRVRVDMTFPEVVDPETDVPLEVRVVVLGAGNEESPVPNVFVELTATGGVACPPSGKTDADGSFAAVAQLAAEEPTLTIAVTVTSDEDPERAVVLGQASVEAATSGAAARRPLGRPRTAADGICPGGPAPTFTLTSANLSATVNLLDAALLLPEAIVARGSSRGLSDTETVTATMPVTTVTFPSGDVAFTGAGTSTATRVITRLADSVKIDFVSRRSLTLSVAPAFAANVRIAGTIDDRWCSELPAGLRVDYTAQPPQLELRNDGSGESAISGSPGGTVSLPSAGRWCLGYLDQNLLSFEGISRDISGDPSAESRYSITLHTAP